MRRGWIVAGGALALFVVVGALGIGYVIARYKYYYAPSGSMAPTIPFRSTFVVDRFAYGGGAIPKDGDVIVFNPPIAADAPFFKRVVAGPGERLSIRGGRLTRNGRVVPEPYIAEPTNYTFEIRDYGIVVDGERLDPKLAAIPPRSEWTAADTIPTGCFVVLGDNRNNSEDSHAYGFLCPGRAAPANPKRPPSIVGRAILPGR